MPYSPRERDHLRDNVVFRRATGDDISDQEVLIRKEVRCMGFVRRNAGSSDDDDDEIVVVKENYVAEQ